MTETATPTPYGTGTATSTPTPTGGTATSTATPTTTATPTSTATPASSATPTTTSTAVAGAGVPSIDPDYVVLGNGTYDVAGWWARHPYNPANPPLTIASPSPVINAANYPSLQAAIDALPATGGTISCPAGVYGHAAVIGRSNVHFLGQPGTVFRGINLFGGTICQSYDKFNFNVANGDPASVTLFLNPPRNFYFKNITFDANGYVPQLVEASTPDWVCLGLYCVRDVLCDNCAFQNMGYQAALEAGLITGNRGNANIWARNCAFHGNSNTGTFMGVFLDGPRGCGVVNSTIDGWFGSRAFQFQTNDDFSLDLNHDGVYDLSERREARYNVMQGVASTADCHIFCGVQGFSNLVQNCSQSIHISQFVDLVSREGSRAGCVYHFTGNIVRTNTVQNTDYYLTVDGSNISPGTGSTIGVYTVQNNKVTDSPPNAMVLETAPVVGPNMVTGNTGPNNIPVR